MQYPGYTLEDYPGEEYPTTPHTYPPLPPRWGLMLKALLGVLASLIVAVLVSTNAHASEADMSAQLEEYNAMCFDEQGEWLETDGCIESAESLGIEIDNLLESERKGCTLEDMYEDYSCKGPQGPSSPSEAASSVSEQGCVTVDMADPEVSGQDIDILTKYYGFDARLDNDELLYSPECFEQGIVPFDFEGMRNNPCYDVLSDASGSEYWVEYLGCPAPLVSEQNSITEEFFPTPIGADQEENLRESIAKGCAPSDLFEDLSCKGPKAGYPYRPVTQQGTLAPSDWRSHVVPLKPVASYKLATPTSKPSSVSEATTSTLSTTNPYVVHRDSDTGRSSGQVVSESKRAEAHAAASSVQAKLAAAEKAKKAQSKKR